MKQGVSELPARGYAPSLDLDRAGVVGELLEARIQQRGTEGRIAAVRFRPVRMGVKDGDRPAPELRQQSLQLPDEPPGIQGRVREEVRHDDDYRTPARRGTPGDRGDVGPPVPVDPRRPVELGDGQGEPTRERSASQVDGNGILRQINTGRSTPRKWLRGVKSAGNPLEPTPSHGRTPSPWGWKISRPRSPPSISIGYEQRPGLVTCETLRQALPSARAG